MNNQLISWNSIETCPLMGTVLVWCPKWAGGTWMVLNLQECDSAALDMLSPSHWAALQPPQRTGKAEE